MEEVLHILRSKPDETTERFIEILSGQSPKTLPLYEGDVDWDKVVDEVFAHDKVICWW